MGRDKATIEVDGVAMADRVVAAMVEAGALEVARIGDEVPDRHPGEGPLGGVLTALEWSAEPMTVVAPCDLLAPDAATFTALLDALRTSSAVAAVPGRDRPLPVALRDSAAPALAAAFAGGVRSLRLALAPLELVTVALPADALADADTSGDLPPGAR